MGTSTAYSGPNGGTPFIPSWLGDAPTPTPVSYTHLDTSDDNWQHK